MTRTKPISSDIIHENLLHQCHPCTKTTSAMKPKIQNAASCFTLHTVMLLLALSPTLYALGQQVIYVDAANNTGIENGTQEHPFNTIKEGIAASDAGATIMIKAGTYHPDSTWQEHDNALYLKPGIALSGEGRLITIVEGVLVDWDAGNLSCTLEGLSFQQYCFGRGTSEGPFDEPNIIRNCSADMIQVSHSAGIPVNDTTPGPIYGFLFENNDLGTEGSIAFSQGSGVAYNTVRNNTCGTVLIYSGAGYTYLVENNDIQYGIIDASGVCTTRITNNRIYDGCIIDNSGSSPYGIEDQIIEFNTINCNEDSPLFQDEDAKAAIIARPSSVTLRNNTLTCSGAVYGIYSKSGAPFHVIDNTITVDEFYELSQDPDEAVCGLYTKAGWGYVTGNIIHGGQIGYYSMAGTESFSNNEISGSYIGFFSSGAEEVHHNTIRDCHGDGMIMYGLRGPVHNNVVKDNAGSGIHIVRPDIDLGGGPDNCPGNNIITGNGNYDLYIECQSTQYPVLYAKHNVWDHMEAADIMQYDIRDGSDSTGLVSVDFSPFAYLGMEETGRPGNKEREAMEVFPNPTHGKFQITNPKHQTNPKTQIQNIEVVDLYGKVVLKEEKGRRGKGEIGFDVGALPAGIYLVRIHLENQTIVKKIIKI
jgi:hypothetical protein